RGEEAFLRFRFGDSAKHSSLRSAFARQAGSPLRRAIQRRARLPLARARNFGRPATRDAGRAVKEKRGLGRGLDALLPASPTNSNYGEKSVFSCAIEKIAPQKGQPRRHFD